MTQLQFAHYINQTTTLYSQCFPPMLSVFMLSAAQTLSTSGRARTAQCLPASAR
jgi:hypothetical protein